MELKIINKKNNTTYDFYIELFNGIHCFEYAEIIQNYLDIPSWLYRKFLSENKGKLIHCDKTKFYFSCTYFKTYADAENFINQIMSYTMIRKLSKNTK